MIAAASSDGGGDTSITIWNHSETAGGIRFGSNFRTSGVVLHILKFILHVTVVLAATAFLSQYLTGVSV
jgi:hypothetical protein